jgi:hypothetical protein
LLFITKGRVQKRGVFYRHAFGFFLSFIALCTSPCHLAAVDVLQS